VLGWIAAFGCASGPLLDVSTGADREFAKSDGFAPANMGVLAIENPDLLEIDLEELHRLIGSAIGWRGLRVSSEEEADWLISCAFRKRLIWRGDLGTETLIEPWNPLGRRERVVGSSGRELRTRGAMDAEAGPKVPELWIHTLVELRLRSRRTGTIGWSAERRWGRNRHELPDDELRETLRVLLAELRVGPSVTEPASSGAR
jgi:hypothetical protein